MEKYVDLVRIDIRLPDDLKRRVKDKLAGRSLTYIGIGLLEGWVNGTIDLASDPARTAVKRHRKALR